MRGVVGLVGIMLVLTACGGTASDQAAPAPPSSSAAAPSATPSSSAPVAGTPVPLATGPNVSGCFTEKDGKIFTYGDDMPGVITGDGPVGVVITYERNGTVCNWRPLSDRLVAAGYRVLLYARKSTDLPEDVAVAMGKRLSKEKGVKRLFLVGGSIGATSAVPAAEKLGSEVVGVVGLSGAIDPADASRLSVPLLQIGSETTATAAPRTCSGPTTPPPRPPTTSCTSSRAPACTPPTCSAALTAPRCST
ncbi:hypothetical protein ABT294_42030 [Nonomuraea sp. NPDC000554]|uniref:hypothetical protein n=1 Tax=Nonomuraea sp. NPDC000554 TaxID=3154259 RepID=UPI00332783F9